MTAGLADAPPRRETRDRPRDGADLADAASLARPPSGPCRATSPRGREAGRARASCSCATGSTCCSTRARSSRTACWPTPRAADLPADGVVTGTGTDRRAAGVRDGQRPDRQGRLVGGPHRREDRAAHRAGPARTSCPIFWLVDSAGARITDQVELFPGRRGAGRIFYNQVRLSGRVPQICCLFGPSAAGGAYIPAFCDVVIMVEGNASMYLGSPRMAEMVIGEIATLEEMGGARMHATVSGCGDNLAVDDEDAIDQAQALLHATCRRAGASEPPELRAGRAGPRSSTAVDRAGRGGPGLRHARRHRRPGRRRELLRDQAAVRPRADRRARPARRPAGRHRGQQPGAEGRGAVRRLGRQGGPLHLVLRRLQHPAACSWPTCPAS